MIFLLAATALLYLLFLVWLRSGISRWPANQFTPSEQQLPTVSVVVAARNEEASIGRLLNSLLAQDYPREKLEFIIVDDHSDDGTAAIVSDRIVEDVRLRMVQADDIPAGRAPKKWALNQGLMEAKGEIFVLTDADCTMGTGWVRRMTAPFLDEHIGMVVGSSPLGTDRGLWNRIVRVESMGQDALMAAGACRNLPLTASGRNIAIRRAAFDDVGGYGELWAYTSGDDDFMMHQLASGGWGVVPCLESGSEVQSGPPEGVIELIRQRLRFASKGGAYFRLSFVAPTFRTALVLIYLTNIGVLLGQLFFFVSFSSAWLMPWFIKVLADGLLMTAFLKSMERPFDTPVFLLNEVWHSFYVVVLGTLGSFLTISWKGRRSEPRLVQASQ